MFYKKIKIIKQQRKEFFSPIAGSLAAASRGVGLRRWGRMVSASAALCFLSGYWCEGESGYRCELVRLNVSEGKKRADE